MGLRGSGGSFDKRLSTSLPNKVTIIAGRHSGMFLAGIRNDFLDSGLRRCDERQFGRLFLRCCAKIA